MLRNGSTLPRVGATWKKKNVWILIKPNKNVYHFLYFAYTFSTLVHFKPLFNSKKSTFLFLPSSRGICVKIKVTLRLTVGQSVSQSLLVSSPHLGLMTRYLLLFDSYSIVMWSALSDERTGLSFVRVTVCISKSFVIM
jgi:hypothetical protein